MDISLHITTFGELKNKMLFIVLDDRHTTPLWIKKPIKNDLRNASIIRCEKTSGARHFIEDDKVRRPFKDNMPVIPLDIPGIEP